MTTIDSSEESAPSPPDDASLRAYVQIFKQLPRKAAAELIAEMVRDEETEPTSTIMQAAVLTVAGNRLWGSAHNPKDVD